ncbi:MAG: DNA polymerase beta superfamily protein [Gammaproteobacteria bacterium]
MQASIARFGWDARKTLRLFWESNPAFVEWIQSPIKHMPQAGAEA